MKPEDIRQKLAKPLISWAVKSKAEQSTEEPPTEEQPKQELPKPQPEPEPQSESTGWEVEVADLQHRRQLMLQQGGKDGIERQHKQGRKTLRERIDLLVEPGSFDELGRVAGDTWVDQNGRVVDAKPANFLVGTALVGQHRIVLGGEDFTQRGGSPNQSGLRKSIYTEELALSLRIPLVRLHEGGGGSVTGTSGKPEESGKDGSKDASKDGSAAAPVKRNSGLTGDPMHHPPRFLSIARALREVPVVSAAMGPVAGLPAARFSASHFRVMVKETAQLLIAGPALVERAFGHLYSKEELGGWQIHAKNGVVDNVTDSEEEALRQIGCFLSFMPKNVCESPARLPCQDPVDRSCSSLTGIIPRDKRQPYEMRQILTQIFDDGNFFEMSPHWGPGQITGLARLNGHAVAVLANDPNHYAGSMCANAAQKMVRFLGMANTFHLPVVSIVDQPGFLIGKQAEDEATIRHGTEAVLAAVESVVPWVSVVVRRSYGVGQAAHYGPKGWIFHWPSAESGALPIEGGVAVAFRREILASDNPEKKRLELEQRMSANPNQYRGAESFSVNDAIAPGETRAVLCQWLELQQQVIADLVQRAITRRQLSHLY